MRVTIQVWTEGVHTFSSMQRDGKDTGPRRLTARALDRLHSVTDFLEKKPPRRRQRYGPRFGPPLRRVRRFELWARTIKLLATNGEVTPKDLALAARIGERRALAYLQVAATRGQLRRLGGHVFVAPVRPIAVAFGETTSEAS
jgi:hypothetical protein